MDMFDEARAMSGTLMLCRITQKELGKRMGVSQSYIANKLRLLSFSPRIEKMIRDAGLSERHARAILRLGTDDEQAEVIEKTKERGLTVTVDTGVWGTGSFLDTLKKSLKTLKSVGIEVTDRTSYHGNKMYITVCISDI